MASLNSSLISKVARQLSARPTYAEAGTRGSILAVAAGSYGFRADMDELTMPTGFDPHAARLFEAIVESAYLVANADGEFDEAERTAFEHVVTTACGGLVAERQVRALISDLAEQLDEDGLTKRIEMVSRAISKAEHAREVLRVAALLASVSGGVSDVERAVMEQLTKSFGLEPAALDRALSEVSRVLAG